MNLILIGMMGSGKSTIGRKAAAALGWDFLDSDQRIEEKAAMSIPKIFESQGEARFRDLEKQAIAEFSGRDRAVIATGGGAPCHEENWTSFRRKGRTVWLKVSPQTLHDRLKRSRHPRPLLMGEALNLERIAALLVQREPFYARADWTLAADPLTADQAAAEIVRYVKSQTPS